MAMSTAVSSAIARAIARLGQPRLHPGQYWISAAPSAHGVGAVGLPATTAAQVSRLSESGVRAVHSRSAVDVTLPPVERPLAGSRHFADDIVFSVPSTPHSAAWAPKSSPLVTQLATDAGGVLRIASLHPGFLRALEAGDMAALREARRCAGSSSSSCSSSYSSWWRRQRQRGFKQRRLAALGGRFAWSMAVAGAIQAAQLGDESHADGAAHPASQGGYASSSGGATGGATSSFGAPQMRNGLRFDQSSASLASVAALLGGAFGSSFPGASAGSYGPPAMFRNNGSAAGGSSGSSAAAAGAAGQAAAGGPGSDGGGSGNAASNLLAGLERAFADNHELAYQLGIGSVAGFCSGYAVKKVSKAVAFTVGVGFIAVQLAHYWGYAPPVS